MQSLSLSSVSQLSSFIHSFAHIGFSGSRHSGSVAVQSCQSFLPLVSGFSGSVSVGCARGVDTTVRAAFPSASVFSVQQFAVSGRVTRGSFALRSAAMVQHIVSHRGLLVAFPLGACPSGVAVSSSFRGCGSGTWGSVALALGLGGSVLVVAPSGVSSAWFGALGSRFQPVGAAPCGGSLWLSH